MARTWAADNRITEEPGHVKMKRLVDEWKASLEQERLAKVARDSQTCHAVDQSPVKDEEAERKAPEISPQRRRGRPSKRAG